MSPRAGQPSVDFSLNAFFLKSNAARPRLRVGILVDGQSATAVERQVILDVLACNYADIVCVVRNSGADTPASARPGTIARVLKGLTRRNWWRSLGYSAYRRWYDSQRKIGPDPLQSADISDLLGAIDNIDVLPKQTGHVDRLDEADIERIRGYDLDVILRFGFRILRGKILAIPRHGVWSYHHGDSGRYRGGPALLWELIEHNPISGVVLQSLTEDLDAGPVLARATFSTTAFLSVSENRFVPYWSAEHFVIRALHELHQRGALAARDCPVPSQYTGRRPIYRAPTNLETAKWLASEVAVRSARAVARRFRRKPAGTRWTIGLRRTSSPLHEAPDPEALSTFRWVPVMPGGYFADPFLVEHQRQMWMFFEEYVDSLYRGVISCVPLESPGRLGQPFRVLDRPYHLSYPHVVAYAGELFMVPESAQAGTVDLFRAVRFPDKWVFERTLLNFAGVDSTPFEHDGRWWLFSSPRIVPGAVALTYLWTAESLLGPWQLASDRPVSRDVRSARGAGRVFRHRDELWRPSQDCCGRYGRALVLNRIDRLGDPPVETSVKIIEPGWLPNMARIHTYNAACNWEAIDGLFDGDLPSTEDPQSHPATDRGLAY